MAWESRIIGHGEAAPADLVGNPRNWRTHPQAQRDALAGVLDEVGWVQDVIVNKRTGYLVDGHARVAVAAQRGETSVPVVYVDLSEDEERLILATLDPLSAMAEADDDALADLLAAVTAEDGALASMLEALAPLAPVDGSDTEAGEPAEEPYVKRGEVWQVGEHRIMCGDSTNGDDVATLMDGDRADICFTSPPYALGKSIRLSGNTAMSEKSSPYVGDDDASDEWPGMMSAWFDVAVDVAGAVLTNVQPLAGNKRDLMQWIADRRDRLVDVVVWDKGHAAPQMAAGVLASQYEWVVIMADPGASRSVPYSSWRGTVSSVYSAPPQRQNEYSKIHAATFPLHLPEWVLMTLCDEAASVYDPFLGSGTTAIAAANRGRKCYGMEISPAYAQVSIERLAAHIGETPERAK